MYLFVFISSFAIIIYIFYIFIAFYFIISIYFIDIMNIFVFRYVEYSLDKKRN